jgi:AcrR family transcriptional regulator
MPRRRANDPRKTPRQSRSRDTYDAVLEATARILETKGLEAANTNAIAERAGISVGSLYQYFPGKQAIFAELIRRSDAATAEGLATLVAATAGQDLATRLRALVHAAVAQQFARPRLARTLDYLEAALGADEALVAADERIVASVEALLRAHGHELAGPPTKVVARDMLWIAKGMIDGASFAGETDPAQVEARVVGALLGYLGVRGPGSGREPRARGARTGRSRSG